MKCDLDLLFGSMARGLPIHEKHKATYSAKSFLETRDHLETDQLVVKKGHHDYEGTSRIDSLNFFAEKPTYQQLGLLTLSVVFREGGARVDLTLTNPATHIRRLIIEYGGLTERSFTYRTRPDHFLFFPEKVQKHPWTCQNLTVFDLPTFKLTNLKDFVVTEEDRANRDTVMGFGDDDASVMLAELLLRFGSPQNEANEIVLEGEGGFRGVGRFSAEASFHLPGSLAWPSVPLFERQL